MQLLGKPIHIPLALDMERINETIDAAEDSATYRSRTVQGGCSKSELSFESGGMAPF